MHFCSDCMEKYVLPNPVRSPVLDFCETKLVTAIQKGNLTSILLF